MLIFLLLWNIIILSLIVISQYIWVMIYIIMIKKKT